MDDNNDKKSWQRIAQNWWVYLALPVVSLVLSIIVSKTQSDVGTTYVLLALFIVVLLSIEITAFLSFVIPRHIKGIALDRFEVAMNQPYQDDSENDYLFETSIIKDEKLSVVEKNGTFEEIWVVSNDLTTEIEGGLYSDIVPYNLNRGIKYKIFTPENNMTKMRIETLKRKYHGNDGISFYFLTDDFFFLVSRLDFTIYDPYKNSKTGRQGYIGLDLPDSEELYAARINVDAIASKLLEHIQTSKVRKIDTGDKGGEESV